MPGASYFCGGNQAGSSTSCANINDCFLVPSSAGPFMSHSPVFVLSIGPVLRHALAVALLGASVWSHAEDPKAAKYFEQALGRYEKKDIPGAIIELKNALQIDPTMLSVQMLLGKALMQDGQVAAAEVAFLEALRLGVNRGEIVVPLGQAYLAQGKQKLFMEQPQFALPGLPPGTQLQLLLLRAAAASDLGDSPGALKAMDEARAIDPKSPEVWLAEVPVRIRTRQFKEATTAAERGLALAPGNAEGWYQKGSVLHVMGDLKSTLAAYDRTIEIDPNHADARIARAGLYIDLNRASDAAKDLDALKDVAPKDPRAAYLRALLAERNKDTAAANAALKTVTELIDPVPLSFIRYRPQLLMLNGLSHFGLGQREKAKQYLEQFQKTQGNSPASKLLAQILLAEPNVPRGIEVLETYLKAQPGDAQAMTLLATAYVSQGRHARATALMQDALKARDTPEMHTVLGISLIRGGQAVEGVNELDAVFRKDPRQVHAGLTLLGIYLRSGQGSKAVGITESLVKQFPQNATYYNLLGTAQRRTGNVPAAKAAFEQALKLDGSLVAAKLNLAGLEIATKAYDSATARLTAILQADEKNAEAMYEMSVVSDRRGDSAATRRWLEKANDLSGPKEVRWGLALVDYFLRTGQAEPALQVAKGISGKAPDNLRVLMAYGRAQLASGDTIGAKSTLNGATRFADYNAPLQVELALLQLSANNLDGAVYSLEKALSGQPDFLPASALMAEVELRRNDPAKAEKRAREIISRHPQRAIGYSLLGDIARARGQAAAATENYRRAHQIEPASDTLLRLSGALSAQDGGKPALALVEQWLRAHPKDKAVLSAAGDAYARSGNFAMARSSYESVLKLAPDDSGALNNLANVLLRLKDPAAIKIAEQAVAKNPANSNAIDTLGWALFENGQADRALKLLRDARLRDPSSPVIRYHLAAVLAQAGRKSEAREELEAALKGAGPFESLADAQALLRTLK